LADQLDEAVKVTTESEELSTHSCCSDAIWPTSLGIAPINWLVANCLLKIERQSETKKIAF
jgi:hypothetical protein